VVHSLLRYRRETVTGSVENEQKITLPRRFPIPTSIKPMRFTWREVWWSERLGQCREPWCSFSHCNGHVGEREKPWNRKNSVDEANLRAVGIPVILAGECVEQK
jgi:hypothetical protein